MSRRSDRKRGAAAADESQHSDVLIQLKCPHRHVVGHLYRADLSGPLLVLNERRTGGGGMQQHPSRRGRSLPYLFHCKTCFYNTGMQLDLRLSQTSAEQLLQDALADPNRVHTHVLGG